MPNLPETAAAFLACASLGATWSSCSPDFGVRTVVDRFAQIEPSVLLAVDGYRYAGRDFDRRAAVDELRRELPGARRHDRAPLPRRAAAGRPCRRAGPREFAELPFGHPLWVLYSSGTTGPPKALVHSQGGILLEHLKILRLHTDLRRGDRFFWFTTTGWMMWNLLVGGLLTGSAVVLFDGNPAAPDWTGSGISPPRPGSRASGRAPPISAPA